MGLTLLAATLISTSPVPATGSGTDSYFKFSGPPYSCRTIAFIVTSPSQVRCAPVLEVAIKDELKSRLSPNRPASLPAGTLATPGSQQFFSAASFCVVVRGRCTALESRAQQSFPPRKAAV